MATPEETIRTFYRAFDEDAPDLFDLVISPDYVDHGHDPVGRGPSGARSDYDAALTAYGHIGYRIDALVSLGEYASAMWTGHLEDGTVFRGLGLYRVADGKILETTNAVVGELPPPLRHIAGR